MGPRWGSGAGLRARAEAAPAPAPDWGGAERPAEWPEGFDGEDGATWDVGAGGLPAMWSRDPGSAPVGDEHYENPLGYTTEPEELQGLSERKREFFWADKDLEDEQQRFFMSSRLRRRYTEHRHMQGNEGLKPKIVPHEKFPDWPEFDYERAVEKSSPEGQASVQQMLTRMEDEAMAWERGETDVAPFTGPEVADLNEFDPDAFVDPAPPNGTVVEPGETYRPVAKVEQKIVEWKQQKRERKRREWKARQISLRDQEASFLDPTEVDWRLQFSFFRGTTRTKYSYEELYNAATKYGEKPTFDDLMAIQGMPHTQAQIQDPAEPADLFDPDTPLCRSRDSIVDAFSACQLSPETIMTQGNSEIVFEDAHEGNFSGVDPCVYSLEAKGMLVVDDPELIMPLRPSGGSEVSEEGEDAVGDIEAAALEGGRGEVEAYDEENPDDEGGDPEVGELKEDPSLLEGIGSLIGGEDLGADAGAGAPDEGGWEGAGSF